MKILFVCSGNTCRSKMAEALFYKYSKALTQFKLQASSAGLIANDGDKISELTIEVLKEDGIDLESIPLFTRGLTEQLIASHDIILCMQIHHKERILSLYKELVKDKVFLLSEYAEGKLEDVLDPFGCSKEAYQTCKEIIKKYIIKIIEKLQRKTDKENN